MDDMSGIGCNDVCDACPCANAGANALAKAQTMAVTTVILPVICLEKWWRNRG